MAKENCLGFQRPQPGDHLTKKGRAGKRTQMQIGEQGHRASLPGLRQMGQPHGDPADPQPVGVDETIERRDRRQTEQDRRQRKTRQWPAKERRHDLPGPACQCREEGEAQRAQPRGAESVDDPQRRVVRAKAQNGGRDEGEGQSRREHLPNDPSRHVEGVTPRRTDQGIDQEQDDRDERSKFIGDFCAAVDRSPNQDTKTMKTSITTSILSGAAFALLAASRLAAQQSLNNQGQGGIVETIPTPP